jgi:hypothetical protein
VHKFAPDKTSRFAHSGCNASQLDTNSTGTLNEPQFLKLVKIVTRKEVQEGMPAHGEQLASEAVLTASREWKAVRVKYSADPNSRAKLQVEVKRVEASITIEPLEILLTILQRVAPLGPLQDMSNAANPKTTQTSATELGPNETYWMHKNARGSAQRNLSQRSASEEFEVKEETIVSAASNRSIVGWIQDIRTRVFSRESETLEVGSMDFNVVAGPLDVAVIPNSDSASGENALVFVMQRLEFSSQTPQGGAFLDVNLRANGERVFV